MKKIIIRIINTISVIFLIGILPMVIIFFKYRSLFGNTSEYLFDSGERDPTEIYSLSEEQYHQMTGFNIDDKGGYYNEQYIKFINNYIIDEDNRYSKREKRILKKVKEDIEYLETLKDTEYMFEYIKKDCPSCSDHKGCIYNPTQKNGYCIWQYM